MTQAQWYYSSQGRQLGPVGREVLRSMIVTGQVRGTDMVWSPGMAQWQAAQTLPELMTATTPAQQGHVPDYAIETYFYVEFAGFWRRVVAAFIDTIIIGVLMVVVGVFIPIAAGSHVDPQQRSVQTGWIISLIVIGWFYYAAMECSSYQATLGKLAIGIFVTDEMGHEVSFRQASGRFFGKAVSLLILGIGFPMAGWTQRKQALHDMMAGTLVVRKK